MPLLPEVAFDVDLIHDHPNYDGADVVDVLAMIADPTGEAAHRVRLATDPCYMVRYLDALLCESLKVPKEYLGL